MTRANPSVASKVARSPASTSGSGGLFGAVVALPDLGSFQEKHVHIPRGIPSPLTPAPAIAKYIRMNISNEGGNPTRDRLLAAARLLFARDGFEGASIRDITGKAGANLGAVTYHFGCKEALYHEVLRRVLEPLRDRILALCGTTAPPLERLAGVIRGFFQHLDSSPEHPRFFLQEMVIDGPPPRPILEVMLPVSAAVAGVVAEGQRDGSIRPGISHLFVLSLFAQPIYMALITRKMQGGMDGALPPVGMLREAMVEHAVEFALGGLRADGGPPDPGSFEAPGEPGGDGGILSPPDPPAPAGGSDR